MMACLEILKIHGVMMWELESLSLVETPEKLWDRRKGGGVFDIEGNQLSSRFPRLLSLGFMGQRDMECES